MPVELPVATAPRAWSAGLSCRRGSMLLLAAAVLAVGTTGCVYRRMTIRSDPPGALVTVDGREVGYTPCSVDFTYYGTREIMLVKDGYESLTLLQKVPAPWYQYPVVEFVADNLWPHKTNDRRDFIYRLHPQALAPTQELLDRANSLRSETQVGP